MPRPAPRSAQRIRSRKHGRAGVRRRPRRCSTCRGHEDLDEAERGRAHPRHDRADGAALRHAQPRVLVRASPARCPTSSTSCSRGRRLRFYPTHRFARLHDALPGPRATARAQVGAALARARAHGTQRSRAGPRVSETPGNLAGQLLIAEPRLADPELQAQRRAGARARRRGRARRRPQPARPRCRRATSSRSSRALVDAEDVLHDGGPVQRDGVVVLADFAEPEESERLVVGSVGMLSDLERARAALRERAPRARLRRATPAGARASSRASCSARTGSSSRRASTTCSARTPGELWSSVLERKGGSYRLVSRMPDDPSLN